MHAKTFSLVVPVVMALTAAVASYALAQSPEERGRAHFTNPTFAGGQKACNTCHPNGRGLEKAGTKTKFTIMGESQNSLEEAINACITHAIQGTAIPVDSKEMKEMVSYIKSLGGNAPAGHGR